MRKIAIFLTALLFISIVGTLPAHAQEVSVSLMPSAQEIVSQPGQSINLDYTLTNLGDPQQMSIKIVSLEPQADGTMQVLNKLEGPIQTDIINSDAHLKTPFFLKTNERKRFTLAIQIPQIVQEKDYYIGLVAQSQAPPTNEGTINARAQLGLVSSIAVSVTSDGSLETKPKIVSFRINSKNNINLLGKRFALVVWGENVPLTLEISNQGRHLIHANGVIISRGLGPQKKITLAQQSIFAFSQNTLFANNLSSFFVGPYTISATVNFGPSSPVIYATTYVLAIPSLPILGVVAGVILFFIFRRLQRKNSSP